jgi:HSP20 family protein
MTEAVKDIETKELEKVETRTEVWAQFDVVVRDKYVEVLADVPGVMKDGIEITLHKNILDIKARRDDYDGLRKKDYKCSFTLGEEVSRTGITAKVENGVLKVTVPMAKDSGVKQIPIKS